MAGEQVALTIRQVHVVLFMRFKFVFEYDFEFLLKNDRNKSTYPNMALYQYSCLLIYFSY